MRPAARLQAIADLLPTVLADRQPANRMVQLWRQKNRYAGSTDRRDITNRLFAILRHYGHLTARLDSETPLLVTMLAAHLLDEMPLDEVLALTDGSPYAPVPLTGDDEKKLRHAAATAPKERAGQLSVPDWLLDDIEAQLGEASEAVLSAMLSRAPVDVRVNTLKTDIARALQGLSDEGFAATPHRHVENALRLEGVPRSAAKHLIESESYRSGWVEVQDAGAQAVAAMCHVKPFETVMDFCAGAGGKALPLAAQMQNKGRLLVHDAIDGRMTALPERAKRAGVKIIETVPSVGLADFTAACDLVVADVPCSGAGRWRRTPETKWRLTPARLAELHEIQAAILSQAAGLVKPGGRLVYMTCSLLASENSRPVAKFIQQNHMFERDDEVLPFGGKGETQLHPLNADTDGLYCAVLRRGSGGEGA